MSDSVKKLVILGTGGTCTDILDAVLCINDIQPTYDCIGFLDDNPSKTGQSIHGIEVLGPLSMAGQLGDDVVFVFGIGSTNNYKNRQSIFKKAGIHPDRLVSIIHPTAAVSRWASIGRGVVILQNVTVSAHAKIGDHVMILANSLINHDCIVGDYTCIAGGVCLSGGVEVGHSSYLGSNCTVRNNVKIGNRVLVGMGSCVLNPVEDDTVVVGNPARKKI